MMAIEARGLSMRTFIMRCSRVGADGKLWGGGRESYCWYFIASVFLCPSHLKLEENKQLSDAKLCMYSFVLLLWVIINKHINLISHDKPNVKQLQLLYSSPTSVNQRWLSWSHVYENGLDLHFRFFLCA